MTLRNYGVLRRDSRWGNWGSVARGLALTLTVFLAGCVGIQTMGEQSARERLERIGGRYASGAASPEPFVLSAGSSLNDFLRYAVLRSPEVSKSYFEWAASVERITIARSLPDPVLTMGFDFQRGLEESVSNMIIALVGGLAIELPGPGKLRARADLATAESNSKYAEFQAAVAQAALAARAEYYSFYLLSERERILDVNLELVDRIVGAVRLKEVAGLASRSDVLQVERERAILRRDRGNLDGMRAALAVEWQVALGVSPNEPAPPIPAAFETDTLTDLNDAQLDEAIANNPHLHALQADLKRAEAAVNVAYRSRVPDFTLGMEAEVPPADGSNSPTNMTLKPRLEIRLPIWRDRIVAQIAEAEALKQAAHADYSAAQFTLIRDYARTVWGLRETRRSLNTLDDSLLPSQREIVELSQRGYAGGVTSVFELIEQQRRLLDLEISRAEELTEHQRLAGELSLVLLGRPVVN